MYPPANGAFNDVLLFVDQPDRFEMLIRLIPMIEKTSRSHSDSLHNLKCVPSKPMNFPPLHKEIFDTQT